MAKLRAVIGLLAALGLVACAAPRRTYPLYHVVNGQTAVYGDAPYQVELAWADADPPVWVDPVHPNRPKTALDDHLCGGALIAADWVLTAAHCVEDERRALVEAGQLVVRAGTGSLLDPGSGRLSRQTMVFQIDRIVPHPDYQPSTDFRPPSNDLALIHLTRPMPLDDPRTYLKRIATIALPQVRSDAPMVVRATGWGSTRVASGVAQIQREQSIGTPQAVNLPMSANLQKVALRLVSDDDCARQVTAQMRLIDAAAAKSAHGWAARPAKHELAAIPHQLVCAGDVAWRPSAERRSTCQGDSGGPIVAWRLTGEKLEPVLVALTGWAVGCAQAPGLYTRISDFTPWIRATTGLQSGATASW